jgi:hypothetical protein
MKRIKTLLIFSLVLALSFSLFGCKLLPWGDSATEETAAIAGLPEWLSLAHRAEAAEEPEIDEEEEEADEEEAAETTTPTATSQPATTQQPTQQTEQPAQSSGTPRWQQPGTMDYLAKLELDRLVEEYIELKRIVDKSQEQKDRYEAIKLQIPKIAAGIGIHADTFKQIYGETAPYTATGESSTSDFQHSFEKTESPTGW